METKGGTNNHYSDYKDSSRTVKHLNNVCLPHKRFHPEPTTTKKPEQTTIPNGREVCPYVVTEDTIRAKLSK